MSSVEQQLGELRAEVREMIAEMRAWRPAPPGLPMVLSVKSAAVHLSRSVSHVREMIRAGAIATVDLSSGGGKKGKKGIPRSEIERLAKATTTRPRRGRPAKARTAPLSNGSYREFVQSL